MQITSSYKVKLLGGRSALLATAQAYRRAVAFLISAADENWAVIGPVYEESAKRGQAAMERMVHKTRDNPAPRYAFDALFYKFPSYFRRAAISAALGAVSSYRAQLKAWETAGRKGRNPKLTAERSAMPVFFRDGMSRFDAMLAGGCGFVELKLFTNNDWVWVSIPCRQQDVKYLARQWGEVKASAPTLVLERKPKGRHTCYLRFAFEEQRSLSLRDAALEEQTVLAVDLGLNSDAVCSVMKSDGTVIARKFINFPIEKDHLNHLLNRIRRLQREHGAKTGGTHEWELARRLNADLSRKVANAISDTANLYSVNVIVFERLEMTGKIRGKKKQRLHMWRKMDIQHRVEHKAHRNLMRISRICAWNTSRLAYDGSGPVVRDEGNHRWATFSNGKRYNCDLSASYNIGARYFLRELCKQAPELSGRLPSPSRRTYADLRQLRPGLFAA